MSFGLQVWPVSVDEFGAMCQACFGTLYVVRIERGPRIGTRVTYRHVVRRPACGKRTIVVDQGLTERD